MAPLRVVVVEGSPAVRRHLVAVLEAQPDVEVVGETGDGREVVDLCARVRPDVVCLDLGLGLDGTSVVEQIMAGDPRPILVVSSGDGRADHARTDAALAAGAVDALEKPPVLADPAWDRTFVAALRRTARIPVITHPRARLVAPAPSAVRRDRRVVAIGASTGGPGALVRVLGALPADFPLPVLVVLHVGDTFGSALSDWLDGQIALPVRLARDDEPLPPVGRGCVLLAPPGRHLVLERGRLRLVDTPERHACRPSVDDLFLSLAAELGPACVACLLTGMGRDGAAGLLAVRRAGGVTIAQDEATSVVHGMPRAAVRLGAVTHELPVDRIGPMIDALVRRNELGA